jgi:hypothetical protein
MDSDIRRKILEDLKRIKLVDEKLERTRLAFYRHQLRREVGSGSAQNDTSEALSPGTDAG